MPRAEFRGKTKAYRQFSDLLWRTRSLVDLGVVGIDNELEKKINPIIAEFSKVKGVRGRRPKAHERIFKTKKLDDGYVDLELDRRSAFFVKGVMENYKKRYNELRYFHYANLAVAIWAAFETYNAALFEQLYHERPELLKSSEQLTIKDAVENRESLLDFLIERQLESIGHLKLREVIDYYKKRLGIEVSDARCKQLETYYFLRNVVAHKTGLVRPAQKVKASAEFSIVGDEIRVSKRFLMRMADLLENTVQSLERQVISKFYGKGSKPSLKATRSGLRTPRAA